MTAQQDMKKVYQALMSEGNFSRVSLAMRTDYSEGAINSLVAEGPGHRKEVLDAVCRAFEGNPRCNKQLISLLKQIHAGEPYQMPEL